jgi:hypothetical protein
MELHPLPRQPDFAAIRDRGQVQAVARGPRTISEILTDARRSMELEDAYCAWLTGSPLPPRIRHPRRTLRQWLSGRRPEPAPLVSVSSVETVFTDGT